jgi:hypothetical protein
MIERRWEDLFTPAETARIAAEFERGRRLLDQRVWNAAARRWEPRRPVGMPRRDEAA